ncbi:MAG TPA: hypothetical protein VK213_10220 [Bacteroidales bacterium]|nr:hypothetical protein [Bacteroidales bacterium]
MKKLLLALAITIVTSLSLFAQNPNQERLNAYKIGFFTKRLELTSSEAEKFWPLYNDYQAQKIQVQTERLGLMRTFNQAGSTMSDEELATLGDKLVGTAVKETELAVAYHAKLKKLLPPEKVIRYYQAENQYKTQLLNELQNRPGNRPAREIVDPF